MATTSSGPSPASEGETQGRSGDEIVTAALVVIGDEILSGRTKDKNIGHIAERLTEVGIRLLEVRIVPDEAGRIIEAVNALRERYDYVFTTGGIGPTHDDITAPSVAEAFGVPIAVDERALAMMRAYYEGRGLELTEARKRMARIPKGAALIANEISHTPGFMLENVIVMAGVPAIMQAMLEDVLPRLKKGRPLRSLTITVMHPESEVAALLARTQDEFPDVAMGSYPFVREGRLGTNLVLRSTDEARLEAARAALSAGLTQKGLIQEPEA